MLLRSSKSLTYASSDFLASLIDHQSTKSKLNLLAKARSATEELETDLNQLRESAKLKAAERAQLEKQRAKLEEDLRQVKAQLRVETEARTLLSELLDRKKSAMRTKLQSRTGALYTHLFFVLRRFA